MELYPAVAWAERIAARAEAGAAAPTTIEEMQQQDDDDFAFNASLPAARALLLGELHLASEQAHVQASQVQDALSNRKRLKKDTGPQRAVQVQAAKNLRTFYDRIVLLETGGFLGFREFVQRRRRSFERFQRGHFAWNDGVEGSDGEEGSDDNLAEDGAADAAYAEAGIEEVNAANLGCGGRALIFRW